MTLLQLIARAEADTDKHPDSTAYSTWRQLQQATVEYQGEARVTTEATRRN